MMWFDDLSKFTPPAPTRDALHVHLHDQETTPGDEVAARLAALERTVADMIKQECACDPVAEAESDDGVVDPPGSRKPWRPQILRSDSGDEKVESTEYQVAHRNDSTRDEEVPTATIAEVQARNEKIAGRETSLNMTAMGPKPAPTAEMSNSYTTGSIDKPARTSATTKSLDPGRTWGTTNDSASRYRQQREQANSLVDAINRKNTAFYSRRS